MKNGVYMHGPIRVVYTDGDLDVILPKIVLSKEATLGKIQSYFWKGFWLALGNSQDKANVNFAIAAEYHNTL